MLAELLGTLHQQSLAASLGLMLGSKRRSLLASMRPALLRQKLRGRRPPGHPPGGRIVVRGLVVRPELRRKGIATLLIGKAIEWARERGATEVQTNVYDFNQPAAAFFASHGLAPLNHRLSRRLDA